MNDLNWNQRLARRLRPLAAIGLLALGGCATAPPPSEQLAVGDAAVERANAAATDAPVELAAARDKIARAHAAYAVKDYVLARQLAEQAQADASLAEAQARSVRARRALTEVRDGVAQLRAEVPRP
jgi:hypothetical protein